MKPFLAALLAALVLGGCKAKPAAPVGSTRPAIDPWAGGSAPTPPRNSRTSGGTSAGPKGRVPNGAVVEVKVVGITDGDTVRLLTSDQTEIKMRMYGIDAPESKMPFGTQAKGHLSDLAFGKTVTAKIHNYDRYGRAVGELTERGDSINERMVRDGYAWWYEDYAKKDRNLESLEQQARSAHRGLWSQSRPQKPWEWRKNKRDKASSNSDSDASF